ncbi:hypothetical protein Krac_8873 [Ktedonobacter racemifer DSM 44963]|uniref:Uncharacterized protein n=1 Tax=Ktedonobacter racemifer DSM 44963 TaxID=485913 RepID=D6TPV4_KTERA|nr:hypothetical protein Krac_8873 [Ktedonobacter racemifer DSM 44963]
MCRLRLSLYLILSTDSYVVTVRLLMENELEDNDTLPENIPRGNNNG